MDVRRFGAYLACAAWFGVRAAQADTTSFERFTPTPAGDWSLGVESVRVETDGTAASVVADYARDPLVMRSGGERVGAIMSDQLGVRLGASAPLHGRVLFFLPGVLAEFFDLRFGAALAYYLDGAQSFALGAELRVVQGIPRFRAGVSEQLRVVGRDSRRNARRRPGGRRTARRAERGRCRALSCGVRGA
jgi:hypothetical protein